MNQIQKGKVRWAGAVACVLAVTALVGCAHGPESGPATQPRAVAAGAATMDIGLIAFNDLHGNLEPPHIAVPIRGAAGVERVPAGGIAYLASAIAQLKSRNPHHAVITAGDMVGASPLVSALFLDEPTIEAVNHMQIDFSAVGNHEFDRGWQELLRLQQGGCEKFTVREPCQISKPFEGARFGFLAANTLREDGQPLLPATGIKRFTQGGVTVTVGFIGMTLKATPTMVSPSGVKGLRFEDEASTANALIPQLRAQGADVIVVAIHEGGYTNAKVLEQSCSGINGDIVPILERLDPAVDVVVSGHTHQAYVCDYGRVNPARPFLLTSAGQYGSLVTEVALQVDLNTRRVVRKTAHNHIVQGEAFTGSQGLVALNLAVPAFTADPFVHQLVARYRAAAEPLAQRPVGRASAPVLRVRAASQESALGNLIADAQLAATRAPDRGGAQLSFMNPGGLRADLVPDAQGRLSYGQLFSVQPFGNNIMVRTYTGAQIRAVLEQQFNGGTSRPEAPRVLSVSEGFGYRYDLTQPAGSRISHMALHGKPLQEGDQVRVAISSFLASGGDGFTVFSEGRDTLGGDQDLDALEAYVRTQNPVVPPATDRIQRVVR